MQQLLMTFHFKVYASLMDSGWHFFKFFNLLDFSRKQTPQDRGKLTPHFQLLFFNLFIPAMMGLAG
jgi:hypothetical protein